MNKNERLNEISELLGKLKAELDEMKTIPPEEAIEEDNSVEYTLSHYINAIDDRDNVVYYLDEDSGVNYMNWWLSGDFSNFLVPNVNPFCGYIVRGIAKQAFKLKKFNDILLAFKFCYDLTYIREKTSAYIIVWNSNRSLYFTELLRANAHTNSVYFSSESVAERCAEFLNKIDPKGELIV